MTIVEDQLGFVRSPSTYVKRLVTDPRSALVGFRNVLTIAILYEIAVFIRSAYGGSLRLPECRWERRCDMSARP